MREVRILLAEDNEDHAFLAVRALRDFEGVHFTVDPVRNGADALDYIYRRGRFAGQPRPDLILLDLKMPKVGGLEVLEQIKTDGELRSIPVVVLTASDRQEDVDAAYLLGGNSYVTKPISTAGLREGVAKILDHWTQLASLPTPPK